MQSVFRSLLVYYASSAVVVPLSRVETFATLRLWQSVLR